MKIWSAITLLSTALYTVSASSVLSLKDFTDFDQTISNNDLILMNFYSPNCAGCKELKPSYEQAANNLQEENVVLAEIDCVANDAICDKYKIQAYPTLRLFRNGRPSNLLLDESDQDSITQFLKRELVSDLRQIHNPEDLAKLKEQEPLAVIAYISPEDKATLNLWNDFAEKLRDDFAFGLVTDKDMMETEQITSLPSVALYKRFDNLRDIHEGAIVPEEIEDFIKLNSVPILAPIEPATFMDYVDAGRPIAYIFSDTQEVQDQMQQLFLPLAQKYKGDFSFVHINATEYGSQADFLSLRGNKWPALAIHNFKTGARFPFDQTKSLDEQGIISFLEQIKNDNVKPVIKSQAFPTRDPEDPVQVVVGNDFEDIVMDTSKDVLLEIYAPWCGHCRKLAPIYQQLGQVLQDHQADKVHDVVIAKMDGTVNDVPLSVGFTVTAYPTIKFIKAGTNEIIDYQGERSLQEFADFLNKHSTKQTLNIDLSSLPKEEQKKRDEL